MKINKLFLLFLIIGVIPTTKTQAQKAWSGDLTIENLQEFASGEYTEVQGSIVLKNYSEVDLTILEKLQKCTGNIDILENTKLESLKGLENLLEVGGRFSILENPELYSYCALSKTLVIDGIQGVEISKGIIERWEIQDNGFNPSLMSLQNKSCSSQKFTDWCFSC